MRSLIPWRRIRRALAGDGGAAVPSRDFPVLLGRMRDEFDRLCERCSREMPALWRGEGGWRWGLDIKDEEGAVVVRAEAPGFEAADFDLEVCDDRMVLRASKKVEKVDEGGKRREVREQECYESVALPAGIAKDKVSAEYHNGVLTVTLPKTAEAKGKRIPVTAK